MCATAGPRCSMEGDENLSIRFTSRNKGIHSQAPDQGDRVKVRVVGRTLDGAVFWSRGCSADSSPLWFTVGAGEVPKGLEEGIQRVGLAQRASLVCSPCYAAQPAGGAAPWAAAPPGAPAVFEVELVEIVSWSQMGKEVWRMRTLPGSHSCVSTLQSCPWPAASLAELFPDSEAGSGCASGAGSPTAATAANNAAAALLAPPPAASGRTAAAALLAAGV